ncbi:MAG: biotin/lipoyl-binding protein [Desulfurivibrionaceae bacterium]|jgi:biotin carboxyl carrier protein|nr:biotin/lipoyl-binding protein [Pseudomonadota bacterium]MBU4408339.1 biotin/lipoyl-binding protein [Pseudomonadota bacterium]MCG2822724.1 biotin/lipoyl-binding protein [Desulfobulbaceae bacterium]MDP2002810.1 biotin/lipoyl-binding protein [Desulfurivibrionaceae bacterium]
MSEPKKNTKMTVFKTDRHEDMAAMFFVGLVVASILIYMAFIIPNVTIKAPAAGKVVAVAVEPGAEVKKGDFLYSLELKGKPEPKKYKAVTNGKILSVSAKPEDKVKKGKTDILVLEHQKGTLP